MSTVDLKAEIDNAIRSLQRVSEALPRETASAPLAVPWLSQLGAGADYAPGDCGPACVAMVANWEGAHLRVDDVSQAMGKPKGFKFSTPSELIEAAHKFELYLSHAADTQMGRVVAGVNAGKPVITLVSYPLLPKRKDPDYPWGHFVVVVGADESEVTYHDPYWEDEQGGAFIACERRAFEAAFLTPAKGNSRGGHAFFVVV